MCGRLPTKVDLPAFKFKGVSVYFKHSCAAKDKPGAATPIATTRVRSLFNVTSLVAGILLGLDVRAASGIKDMSAEHINLHTLEPDEAAVGSWFNGRREANQCGGYREEEKFCRRCCHFVRRH